MIFQLKITLKGIEPPIWRRMEVDPTMAMEELHFVAQSVMGWEAEFDYQFSSGKRRIIDSEADGDEDDEFASDVLIGQAFRKVNDKWTYLYDSEDKWEHEILLEKIGDLEHGAEYPRCTDGARACPPEACGGAAEYVDVLKILKDPKHPEYKAKMEDWEGFDPEEFDKDAINEELHDPDNWVDEDEEDDDE